MVDIQNKQWSIKNVTNINVIVGRNGSGKSRFLRSLAELASNPNYFVQYISPERAGSFLADMHIGNALLHDKNWEFSTKHKNQVESFKKISATKLRELSISFGEKVQHDKDLRSDLDKTFETVSLCKINNLLSNIYIEKKGSQEFIFKTLLGQDISPDQISSGESEIVALGTEILDFFERLASVQNIGKTNILFLDEPDVHLHPDLQSRLARFIIAEIQELNDNIKDNTFIIIATHSTPLLAELARSNLCSIGTKHHGSDDVILTAASKQFEKLAPFFGHPLSLIINKEIPFLIEGEDDERVWVQAYRTSQGKLNIFPCLSQTKDQQSELERECDKILSAIYEDDPKAISLIDGDGKFGDLHPCGCVRRFRLNCYAIENLLLTDDVLKKAGKNWELFEQNAKVWLNENPKHQYVSEMATFLAKLDRNRHHKIKNIRNIIVEILGFNKPWEVVVGQAIGKLSHTIGSDIQPHSIVDYLGLPLLEEIGLVNS
jgi:AAA15 family ATPase/GTPase